MLPALWHLCGRAWAKLLTALSTSTLAVVIGSVVLPVATFLGVLVYVWWQSKRSQKAMSVKAPLIRAAIVAGIELFVWIGLFGWSVAKTVYEDHNFLVTVNRRQEQEIDRLGTENKSLQSQRDALQLANDRLRPTEPSGQFWHLGWKGADPKSYHKTGQAMGQTWFVKEGENEAGTMQFGPYVRLQKGGAGTYEAFWDLRLDEPCLSNEKVVTVTVYDSEKSLLLGEYDILATDWHGRVHEYIEVKVSFVPMESDLRHKYEFRTHWYGKCSLTLQQFGLRKR